ncbi:hypothetical protein LBMAG42_21010 [Deltaproteobacteria bacterium]|nr:hypothetical protein LBMAG42_21010 [Deltaproteobacteria bacterium]
MIFLIGLAARNLARNLRRTVITSVAVVAGVAIMVLGWGLVDGLDDNVLRAARTTYASEVILRPDGYPDDGMRYPLDEAALIPDSLRSELDKTGAWTARTVFPGRIVRGSESQHISVWAYDSATETQVFDRDGWKVTGAWPAPGKTEIALGSGLARLMELKVGDEVVIEGRTRDGAINALGYTVAGIVRVDNSSIDALGVWMEAATAQDLAQLNGVRTHIAVAPKGSVAAAKTELSGMGWTALTVSEECDDLIAMNRIRRKSIGTVVVMIMLIAATGIANTVIMATFERIREIGTLLALGMPRADVRALFLLEGGIMGLAAGILGAAIGGSAVLYWQRHGIDLSQQVDEVGANIAMSTMVYTHFSWLPLLLSLTFGVAIAVGASLWPATQASRIVPADAVKAD